MQGHFHGYNIEDGAKFRRVTVPSLTTQNKYAAQLGYLSHAGFVTFTPSKRTKKVDQIITSL